MTKFKKPAKPVCALCGLDDDVTTVHLGDGVWQHVCTGRAHPEPRVWEESTSGGVDDLALEGLASEWGLYDDLPKCLVPGEPLVEYGVVEYRYKQFNPVRYAALVDRYSHTCLGPSHYTATSFIAGSLGRLWRRGDLAARFSEATGYWSYNGTVSYWGLPGTDLDHELSWVDFAHQQGVDPDEWRL
jgi:hypothetical protein